MFTITETQGDDKGICISKFSLQALYPFAASVKYEDKEQEKAFQAIFPVLQ